jgi:hypothetical protein
MAYGEIRLHTTDTLSLSNVTHTDNLEHLPTLHTKCTQHLGNTDDSRSGIKMFFRVMILVFVATCCRAQVIVKSLHTSRQ